MDFNHQQNVHGKDYAVHHGIEKRSAICFQLCSGTKPYGHRFYVLVSSGTTFQSWCGRKLLVAGIATTEKGSVKVRRARASQGAMKKYAMFRVAATKWQVNEPCWPCNVFILTAAIRVSCILHF